MGIVRRSSPPDQSRGTIVFRSAALALVLFVVSGSELRAQQVLNEAAGVIELAAGQGRVLQLPAGLVLSRIQVTDPEIADFSVPETGPAAGREFVLFGTAVGTTTLIVWDQFGQARVYTVAVSADVNALERQLQILFPGTPVNVSATGNTVILSGQVRDPVIVRRILEIARASGATVINNISAPSAQQILLYVRFAEVNRSVVEALSSDLFALNADRLDNVFGRSATSAIQTLSEGLVRLTLIGADAQLEAVIRALKSTGDFRSLAEPNLITLEGQEATFLAGGEFPFPSVQGGAQAQAVAVQWREFGIRLAFTPTVTNLGSIRLQVAPEVSSLDFANALTLQGFQIPSLLTRRAVSEVELMPGQHLAIAGLLDNNTLEAVDQIPFLGNIPILGSLFRSRSARQRQTELLVVVTPYIVQPVDLPIPLPTGEPAEWQWDRRLRPVPDVPMHPQREP